MARKHNKEHWGSKAAVRYIGSPKGGFRRGRKVKQNRDAIRDVDVVIRGPRPCGASELDTDLLYGVPLASANAEDSAGSAPGILGMETKRGFHWTREIQKGGAGCAAPDILGIATGQGPKNTSGSNAAALPITFANMIGPNGGPSYIK